MAKRNIDVSGRSSLNPHEYAERRASAALPSATAPMSVPVTGVAETLGFVDIGTNSVRLLVARVDRDHTWTTITLQKESVRLGEGEFGATNQLRPEAMSRTISVCRTFVDLARAHGARGMVAVATAATREAENRAAFVRRLHDEAGLDVHIVSGQEEARLIFLGVLAKVKLGERRALVIDIGGGSTEVALGDSDGAEYPDSLKIGAIRLTNQYLEGATGPIAAEVYEAMRRHVRLEAARTRQKLSGRRIDIAYGTSGTIRNLAAIAARLGDGAVQRPDTLRRANLRKVVKLLRSVDLEARRAIPGLNPERADIIIAGAAILDALMEDLGLLEIQALAECGLREGLVLDHLARTSPELARGPSVRERSVLRLARSTAFDESHARHVAGLALELFDSARDRGLHRYGQAERELLSYSALLHDIGTFLNYSDHHLHSHYLVRNANLLGFDEREVAMMAAIALFHRKNRPGPRHAAFAELDRRTRSAVRLLSTLLRIAEYLDRSHSSAVAHASFQMAGKNDLTLVVAPAKDWQLELWRLQDRRPAIEESLGRSLDIRETREPHHGLTRR
ncbi:MAG TPA: Ppx/GppA phosphatase family protein [Thermoleophilia bacterium]|nr:Ppx/GppA phosphatase family protein [Thermoleophilia bacterium]